MAGQNEVLLKEEDILLPVDKNIYTLITIFHEDGTFLDLLKSFAGHVGIVEQDVAGFAYRSEDPKEKYRWVLFEHWGEDLIIEIDDSSFTYINDTVFYYLNIAAKRFIKYHNNEKEVKETAKLLKKLQKHFAKYRPKPL